MLSTAHLSVLKSITQTAVPNVNVTEKRVSFIWIKFNKLISRYTKQTIQHGAIVSMTTQPTPKENNITSKCSLWELCKSQIRKVFPSV